jgi:hypothetical protein
MFGKRRLDNPRLDNRGTVTIFAAVAFTLLVGFAGLVTEYGGAVLAREDTQRVADLAAYSGALAYSTNPTTSALNAAVDRIATLNGIATGDVAAQVGTSPSGDGKQAVEVTVTTEVPLSLSHVFSSATQLTVTANAYAEISSSGAGNACVIALNTGGNGVTLSGGTALNAPSCAVASNYSVTVPCGTSITTIVVNYDSSSAPSEGCSGITAPSGKTLTIAKKLTSDPLTGTSPITTPVAHIATVAAMTAPSAPTVTGGTNMTFGYSTGPGTPTAQVPSGCTATFSSPTWTVACAGAGPFTFGYINVGGGITLNFTNATSATYNFNGYIYNDGAGLHFGGAGTYNIAGGVQTAYSTTTFPAGTYNIGPSTSNCSSGNYSICNTGTTTFAGPSKFVLSNGIYNGGGETLTMGSGSTSNSYNIGKNTTGSPTGNAFYLGGGSNTTLGNATGTGDLFQVVGMVNVSSGGGSCLTVPAATAHDINGSFSTAGGTTLGAGVYTVNGYVALGANGGGDVTCGGTDVGMNGNGVTFVISAVSTIASGTCSGTAFCLAAGYSNVTLVAPSSGTTEDLVVIGPTSSTNTAGATFAEGASNTSLSGVFYVPNGPITLSGGSSVGNGTGQCLELIGSQVTQTGGTTIATTCSGLGGLSTTTSIVLVQ